MSDQRTRQFRKEARINKCVCSYIPRHVIVLPGAALLNCNHVTSRRASNPIRWGLFSSDYRAGIQKQVCLTPKPIKTRALKWSMAGDGWKMVSSPTALFFLKKDLVI